MFQYEQCYPNSYYLDACVNITVWRYENVQINQWSISQKVFGLVSNSRAVILLFKQKPTYKGSTVHKVWLLLPQKSDVIVPEMFKW